MEPEHAGLARNVLNGLLFHSDTGTEAEVAAWLQLPAVPEIEQEAVVNMATKACKQGSVGVLPALLALPQVQAALRDSTALTTGEGGFTGAEVVLAAAATGRGDALDAVLAAGGGVSISVLRMGEGEEQQWGAGPAVGPAKQLQLLLSRGVPPVPKESSDLSVNPIYCLLECQRDKQHAVSVSAAALVSARPPTCCLPPVCQAVPALCARPHARLSACQVAPASCACRRGLAFLSGRSA